MMQVSSLRLSHDRIGHGMRIMLFETCRHTEHLIFIFSHKGDNLFYLGFSIGQCSRLIKNNSIRLGNYLHKLTALYGNMILSGFPHCGKHRNRHRQLKSTGEIHHQKGQRLRHITSKEISQSRTAKTIRNKLIRKMRGLVLRRALQLLGLLNHFHDTIITTGACRFLYYNMALSLFHNCSGIGIASLCLSDRHRLARHGSLINHSFSGRKLSV